MPKTEPPAEAPAPPPNISARFAKALISVGKVVKDETNPRFKKKYATLNATLDVVRPALEEVGLVLSQRPDYDPATQMASIATFIYDEEGASLDLGVCRMPLERVDPQAFGGGISYLRRYSVTSIFNLQVEDDDGESSTFRSPAHSRPRTEEEPIIPGATSAHEPRPDADRRSGPRPPRAAQAGQGLAGSDIAGLRKLSPARDATPAAEGASGEVLPLDQWQLEDLRAVPAVSGKPLGEASDKQLQQIVSMGDEYVAHGQKTGKGDVALRAVTAAKLLLSYAAAKAQTPEDDLV